MKQNYWELLKVVIDGDALNIEGLDIWLNKWEKLYIDSISVPHPSYPQQKHELRPYFIESDGKCVVFMAGELSNCVWCFYVPSMGQPCERTAGMTVNEKLYNSRLTDEFDDAINSGNENKAISILIMSGLRGSQAHETMDSIKNDPEKYGYSNTSI